MPLTILFWAALLALAALAGLAAAWWGRSRFVRGRRALLAVGVFLVVGALGGFFAAGPVARLEAKVRLAEASREADEAFHTDPLLRALMQAEPEAAEALRARLILALGAAEAAGSSGAGGAANATEAGRQAALSRMHDEALRLALVASFNRLPNASDEAAARLAQALLAALSALKESDSLLCLGLLHPASQVEADISSRALARLSGGLRKDLEGALALTLASSVLRPSAAPFPTRADAALSDMFTENLPDFQRRYGDARHVGALFEALADPEKARAIAPETLCAFAQDLLQALLRMPPAERGPGLRRLLGAG